MSTLLTGTVPPDNNPGILDAVIDQNDQRWIKFGILVKFIWFSITELQLDEKSVFAKLGASGVSCLTSKRKNAIKEMVDNRKEFRSGLVADRPGWTGTHFVFGDGSVMSPRNDALEVIVTFPPDTKFVPVGTLEGWRRSISPLRDQPICLFVLVYGLIAPLLRFAPANMLNPQIELVGPRECGKTTMAVAAASIWAGDPANEAGGGQTWDLTALYLDRAKENHSDMLLLLDEGNLAGSDASNQKEVIRRAIFSISSKGVRRRFTDVAKTRHVHVALLSTSNVPLREIVEVAQNTTDALVSRMPTIQIHDQGFGIFDFLPEGYSTTCDAVEAIREAANLNYAVAGRAFVEQLMIASEDDAAFRVRLKRLIDKFRLKFGEEERNGRNRPLSTFALVFAAGVLARKWGILPDGVGKLLPAFSQVLRSIPIVTKPPTAIEQVVAYVDKNLRESLNAPARRKRPLTPKEFGLAPGFLKILPTGDRELTIATTRFQSEFPNPGKLLKEIKAGGFLQGEGGKKPKLSVKTPTTICRSGRVYRITLPRAVGQ